MQTKKNKCYQSDPAMKQCIESNNNERGGDDEPLYKKLELENSRLSNRRWEKNTLMTYREF